MWLLVTLVGQAVDIWDWEVVVEERRIARRARAASSSSRTDPMEKRWRGLQVINRENKSP
jgi:hypothetical protein